MSELKHIALEEIQENPIALRQVDKETEAYLGLVDSIRETAKQNDGIGVLNAISVKPTDDGSYMLIDGLHRLTASRDAGMETIPCQIISMEDAEIKVSQIMANVHKVETKPFQYSNQIRDIMLLHPNMVLSEMATKLAKSTTWVAQRLSLTNLEENIGQAVDDSKITLSNAYGLAKLPVEEQLNFLEQAQQLSPEEFRGIVNSRVKEIRDANRKGRDAGTPKFEPTAFLQKLGAIKTELENGAVGSALVKETGVKGAVEGFKLAIEWVLHLDPVSIKRGEAEFDARIKEKADKKKKAEAERSAKKAEEAKQRADEMREAAEKAKKILSS